MKLYNKNAIVKKIVDMFVPKERTKEYKKDINLLKDAASKQKIQTLYINRIVCAILVFIVSMFLFVQVHNVAIDYIYENPTSENNLLGELTGQELTRAQELTKQDNYFLDRFKNKKMTLEQIKSELQLSEYYIDATEEELDSGAERIAEKPHRVKELRHDVAKIKTVIRERELNSKEEAN